MPKRLTYEFVKSEFEKEYYTLLSKEYKNNHTKLDYLCPEGHTHSITWRDWYSGYRCPYCAGKAKKSILDIKKVFEDEGYILLTKEYKNNKQKLYFICPNGTSHYIRWNDWQQGHRCICSACDNRITMDIKSVRDILFDEGYTLLSKSYKNSSTKLKCICNNGHECFITWHSWQRGHRCKRCMNERQGIIYSGENHPCWRGGKSFEEYCAVWKDQEYKQDIRERDGNKCLNPYCNSKNPNDLTIHHIDYNKKNCHPNNLITVCRSCNSAANKDRKWHKAWYQAIMNRRYIYKKIGKSLEA